jgi:flagellar protein FliS
MFGSMKPGANAYAAVDIDTGALAASPHKLTTMLFDAALLALVMAQQHMKANEIEKKGKSISRALMLIESGLRSSLDQKSGGAIAENLDALYGYMGQQLMAANLKNQPELLLEVHVLLTDLRSAWLAIDPSLPSAAAQPAAQAAAAPVMNAYGTLAPRASSFVYA